MSLVLDRFDNDFQLRFLTENGRGLALVSVPLVRTTRSHASDKI